MNGAQALELTLIPKGALFCGGYSAAKSATGGDTAHDRDGALIPASAVKGALRETALRLVRASGTRDNYLGSIFGDEFAETEGKLCLGPLRPEKDVGDAFGIRHHVSITRITRSAAPGHLFDQRVVAAGLDLVFKGRIDLLEPLTEAEWDLLKLAAELTDRIGAGRGRGIGQVEIRMEPCLPPKKETRSAPGSFPILDEIFEDASADEARDVVLELRIIEPVKLGRVKDRSNVESTDEIIHGSVFRGAVAAALFRELNTREQHPVMDLVFGDPDAVIFGDGHPLRAEEGLERPAIDVIPAPGTLKVPKAGGPAVDEALDLALALMSPGSASAKRPTGLKAAKGSWTNEPPTGLWKRVPVPRRLITRLARDPATGRAADGKLYSLDVIDPGDPDYKRPLIYQIPIRGTAEQIEWVVRGVERGVWVGGTRSRGFGRVELRRVLKPSWPRLDERHQQWVSALTARSLSRDQASSTGVVLALGLLGIHQPRLLAAFENAGLELIGGRSKRQLIGGWNSKEKLPRTARPSFVAGSVWLVRTKSGETALPALRILERDGLGPGRADGWGRLVACHSIHLDCGGFSMQPRQRSES